MKFKKLFLPLFLIFPLMAFGQELDTDIKYLALTFDDGPSPELTPRLLDILKRNSAHATFFVDGRKIAEESALLKRMVAEGNVVGNHTINHKNLSQLNEDEIRFEIESANTLIKNVTGVEPTVFRPPYAGINQHVKNIAHDNNLAIVLWDIYPNESWASSANDISSFIESKAKDGSIIFLHDNNKSSVNAVDTIIKTLSPKGFKFVTVPELIRIRNNFEPGEVYK